MQEKLKNKVKILPNTSSPFSLATLQGFKEALLQGDIVAILTRYSDIMLALLVTGIIGMMIIPLPTWLMDLLLSLNITIAVIILLVAIYIADATKIAAFPTILLITTLFRLGLNISTTRLILLYADAGRVIEAFGNFVVAGNYVVGAVIFLILTLIQFIVISKGSERVAEVAARFTLDALPGKQMSIDADMRAGIIDVEEGRRRRKALERESQLYGSMDGAMKFVKGDAIAGIIITIINIIGGLIIGTLQMGMEISEALQTFTLLTIGDGLVSQIPALIISTSAGMVVTRVSSEETDTHVGKDIGTQVLAQPKAIAIAAGLLLGLAIVPGLPFVPFFVLSCITGTIAFGLFRTAKIVEIRQIESDKQAKQQIEGSTMGDTKLLPLPTPLSLEVSKELTPLIDSEQDGGKFINEMIPRMREALQYELGIQFPGIRVRGNLPDLEPDVYVIKLNEVPLISGRVKQGMCLVNERSENLKLFNIEGINTTNPADGGYACWIKEEQKDIAKQAGFTVWDTPGVMLLHLAGVLKRYSHELLGIQEVKTILETMEKVYPAVVEAVIPKILTPLQLTDILKRLIQEGISIRDMRTILQALAEWGQVEKDTVMLTEYVRCELKRYITFKYTQGKGTLFVYLLDPQIEEIVLNSIQHTPSGNYLSLDPEVTHQILEAIKKEIGNLPPTAQKPVILTTMDIRRYFRRLVEIEFPELAVLSYQELTPEVTIQPLSRISINKNL